MDACKKCEFYEPVNSECRAHPPTVRTERNGYVSVWPNVEPTDSCGEWKDKHIVAEKAEVTA